MNKKGFTLTEVIVAIAVIGIVFILIFSFMAANNSAINDLKSFDKSYFESNELITNAVRVDNTIDNSLTAPEGTFEGINVSSNSVTIKGTTIPYEIFTNNVTSEIESTENFDFNFEDVAYVEKGNAPSGGSGSSKPMYKGQPVTYPPSKSVFPKNAYFIPNEPYGDPFVDAIVDTSKQPGLFFRMGEDDIPELGKSHYNYLKSIGNSITVRDFVGGSTENYNIQYFPETKVSDYLEELALQDSSNPIQIVHFEADTITYGGFEYSVGAVVMDASNRYFSKDYRTYEFDLTNYFDSAETHLVFITDGHFNWSRNNDSYYSDFYNFKVKGGHVYFISTSGKYRTYLNYANIYNNFTVMPFTDQTEAEMGQVTIANTKFRVGRGKITISGLTKMKNIFFYLPFQDIEIKNSSNLRATGGIVARRLSKPSGATLTPIDWQGDSKILGYGIPDDELPK